MANIKINKKIICVILCIIQAVILVTSVCKFFICKSNLYSELFIPADLNISSAEVADERIIVTPENSIAGTVVSSSPLKLSRGSYIVYIDYSTSATGNTFEASCSSATAHLFCSNPANLSVNSKNAYITIRIGGPEEVVLNVDYAGNGSMEIYGMSIHETTDMAKQDLVYSLILCALISLVWYICTGDTKCRKTAFCLGTIIFMASYPLFLDYMVIGHDLPFHLNRIESIKIGLQQDVFPVKIQPFWIYDYGYATGVFYGDILLYFPALLRIMGLSIQSAYMIFVVAINIGTTLISYFSFKKILGSNRLGLLASMLYTLSYYRLLNVYTRAAVGEFCAMMFLPMIFAGLYQIFTYTGTQKKVCLKPVILTAIGLTGIINSHILTCEMVALFVLLTCIVFIKKIFRRQTFFQLFLTVIFTLLLNVGFLVPFLDYYLTEEFIINSSQWQTGNVQNLGLYFAQIFSVFQNGVGGSFATPSGMVNEFCPGLGLPLIIGLFVSGYFLFTVTKEERKERYYPVALCCFLYGVLCIFMSSMHFPWSALEDMGAFGRALVSSIQFPWRFISLATLFITIGSCFILKRLLAKGFDGDVVSNSLILPYVVVILSATSLISTGWYYHSFLSNGEPYRIYDTYELPSIQIYSAEYLPAGSELQGYSEMRYAASPNLNVNEVQKKGTTLSCYVENGPENGYLEVPLINYKGYAAKHLESNMPLVLENGYNNCIRLKLPASFSGNIEIKFIPPIYWRIAESISAVAVLVFIALGVKNYISKRRKLNKGNVV